MGKKKNKKNCNCYAKHDFEVKQQVKFSEKNLKELIEEKFSTIELDEQIQKEKLKKFHRRVKWLFNEYKLEMVVIFLIVNEVLDLGFDINLLSLLIT